MIRLQFEDGHVCPKIFCSLCGLDIDSAADGNVLWRAIDLLGHQSEPIPMSPEFVHRHCDNDRERPVYGGYHWMPISNFMAYLLMNLKLPVHGSMNPDA